eukprot:TRINITY_DN20521_c0_g1_i1.p1 TRINITY_DN20521_c0_g1~~TRINITY_DN20521_c0_g1_i1.p1  ORF type:complete len:188 (+),score=49.42 TRINITY_DN20521_c0_g1_i1:79-564(+)
MVKGVRYNADGSVQKCIFCEIIAGRSPEERPLLYKDDKVAVFVPRTTGAMVHYLSVPIKHMVSIHTVSKECDDVDDLLTSLDVRHKVFSKEQLPHTLAVFHQPPFTSIDHLHLHMLLGPYKSFFQGIKNEPARWKTWNISLSGARKKYIRKKPQTAVSSKL